MQKILVVDDAALNRELLRELLADEYLVDTVEDESDWQERLDTKYHIE